MCLTGTAEIPLGGVCMDKILSEAQLPLKMAAYGHCFRTEAGAAGSGARRGGSQLWGVGWQPLPRVALLFCGSPRGRHQDPLVPFLCTLPDRHHHLYL